MCFVVTCRERADLLALVCGVFCEFVTFPLVSWVRCGTWLYRFLIFATLLLLSEYIFMIFVICTRTSLYLSSTSREPLQCIYALNTHRSPQDEFITSPFRNYGPTIRHVKNHMINIPLPDHCNCTQPLVCIAVQRTSIINWFQGNIKASFVAKLNKLSLLKMIEPVLLRSDDLPLSCRFFPNTINWCKILNAECWNPWGR